MCDDGKEFSQRRIWTTGDAIEHEPTLLIVLQGADVRENSQVLGG